MKRSCQPYFPRDARSHATTISSPEISPLFAPYITYLALFLPFLSFPYQFVFQRLFFHLGSPSLAGPGSWPNDDLLPLAPNQNFG